MKFITEGLILTEQPVKEKDKLVKVFTRSNGVIRCFVRGAKTFKTSSAAAAQPLTYSKLSIYSGKGGYVIDEATVIHSFFNITENLEGFALAQYICDLAAAVIPEGVESDKYLNLTLNTLYMLSKKQRPNLLIKAVYEMRLLSITGTPPNLICCEKCHEYETEPMYFLYKDGTLQCKNCFDASKSAVEISKGALMALRHSIFCEDKKIFAFTASEKAIHLFADCAEKYALACTEHHFNTLEFYKTIRNLE